MDSQLTDIRGQAKMGIDLVNIPTPHEWEKRADYLARIASHPTMTRLYPAVNKRRLAGERRWAKAKRDSEVSITTAVGEVLLF